MTRMEKRRRKNIVTAVILAAIALGVIIGCSVAFFDRNAFYTACAVCGSYAAAYALMRMILWMDGGHNA